MVEGPLALAQILETSLLNHLNFQTLIATKASRVVEAARGGPVLEFGMRRAPERGASAASRASLVGGATYSSAVGVSHEVGFPPKGTHAHSMVQVYMALGEGELAGTVVTCPWHGWQWDVTTGANAMNPAMRVGCYRVTLEGGSLVVDL